MPMTGSAGHGPAAPRVPTRSRPGAVRALGVAVAVAAVLSSMLAAPVSARSSSTPASVTVSSRGGGELRSTVARVDARAAARSAAADHRAQKTLPRLRVDLGAPRGAAPTKSSTSTTPFGAMTSSSTSSVQPRLVSGTTAHQVTTTFPGIEQADTCECEPPDPWVAVSPTYVVQSTNGKVRVSNRFGWELVSMPAWALFAVPADRFDADPRIIWDAVHARWVGVITTFTGDFSENGLRLAISDTADPTGGWAVYAIETGTFLADYPGISSSSTKIVLSSDDFDGLSGDPPVFAGPTLYVLDWSSVLASSVVTVGAYFEGSTRAHFRPAQMLSSGSTVPVIFEESTGDVGYLDVTQTAASINVIAPGNIPTFNLTTTGPHLAQFVAPVTQPTQPGSDVIAGAADERPSDAVYRNGHLWFVATTDYAGDTPNHWAAARWTEVLTSATNVLPTQGFDWITNVPHHYFTPGVGISGNGTVFFVASRTDGAEYPTSVVASVLPSGSSLGTVFQTFVAIDSSTEAYTGDRWGDFLGVAADPSYSGAVWVEHELVAAGGGWRTSVARIVSDATAPSIPGAISQWLVTGSTQTGTVAVKVAWGAATDAGSGIASYLVERSDGGGPFFGVPTASTSLTQPLITGVSVRYRITARDILGNVGPSLVGPLFTPTLTQSNTSSTVYTTGWGTTTSSAFSGGSTRYSSTAGKYATFTATNARSIAIVATKGTTRGSFKVYVDGVYKATVSTYSTTARYRQLVYMAAWSTPGTHKVKVVISGTSGHPRVDLDAFVVLK